MTDRKGRPAVADFVRVPPPVGWVELAPGYKMAVIGRWPNAFHRWTTRLAFGWRWERSND